jgi:hypothetical protein
VTFYENGGGAIYLQPVELSTELKFHNVHAPSFPENSNSSYWYSW